MFSVVAGSKPRFTIPAGFCEEGPNCPLLKKTPQFGQSSLNGNMPKNMMTENVGQRLSLLA